MPQPCKICRHENRTKIEAALLEGYPALRAIGTQYGVSKDALHRHRAAHLRDDDQADDQAEARQANAGAADSVLKHRKTIEPGELRSATETTPILNNQNHSNEPDADPPYVEAHYSVFLDRWRGRISIRRDEMAAWEYEQTEEIEGLLDEAMRRGDLWRIGDFYGQTFKTMARFTGRA
jgi:hypothetical protein